VKAIEKAMKEIGEILNRVLEALLGQNQPQPQLIPIPVRSNSRRVNRY
jgi:predicted RNase H-like HicB family nuclease